VKDELTTSSTINPSNMEFSLLDTTGSKTYELTVFGSCDDPASTKYTVLASSTTSKTLYTGGNTTQWATFSNLTPDANGKITLQTLLLTNGGRGALNVMDLAIYDTSGLGAARPASPTTVNPVTPAPESSGSTAAAASTVTPTKADTATADNAVAAAGQSLQTKTFTAQINFQPASVVAPEGYIVDSGLPFGKASNGYSYGWTKDLSAFAVQRNNAASPDIRYDTAIMLVSGGTWEMAVPNGMYDVKIVAGTGGSNGSGTFAAGKFSVEGVPTTPAEATAGWLEQSITVVVTDGRLTITASPGSSICFVQITGR
jgi:hypothetical protein